MFVLWLHIFGTKSLIHFDIKQEINVYHIFQDMLPKKRTSLSRVRLWNILPTT